MHMMLYVWETVILLLEVLESLLIGNPTKKPTTPPSTIPATRPAYQVLLRYHGSGAVDELFTTIGLYQ